MKMTKLIYLFAVPLLVASCISEEVPITDASDHFFKVSTANPDIQQIVFLLKQKNDSVEFTSKFINAYGYPMWENARSFCENKRKVYAIPVKNLNSDKEIEAIWYFSIGRTRTHYHIYTRKMADVITRQIGNEVEQTWMFDYFTQYALHKKPVSGLTFINNKANINTRSWDWDSEENCELIYTAECGPYEYDTYYCWTEERLREDRDTDELIDGGGNGEGGDLDWGDGGSNNSSKKDTPRAKAIFRNSNMTEENWIIIENMLDKIVEDCMGEALYNELANLLNGKTLSIQFGASTTGSFGYQGESTGICLGRQMESNQLFHEMMHAYRAYQETTASYKESTLNGEIEAWYAQYLYTSNLPEYKDSKWEDRDNTDPRRRRIKSLTNYIDNKGNLLPGVNRTDLESKIKDDIVPTFHKYHYTADKYPFEYNRPGLENFKCINKLTINC